MSSRLPERIDPIRLVQQGKVLTGRYDLAELPRLAALLAEPDGEVRFEFQFGRDAGNRPVVSCHVSAELRLICQRCLETIGHRVDNQNTLELVAGLDEAQAVPEQYESFLVEEATVSLRDMVEEELLLGVPAFPKHSEACVSATGSDVETTGASSVNPFSALGKLKDGNEKAD